LVAAQVDGAPSSRIEWDSGPVQYSADEIHAAQTPKRLSKSDVATQIILEGVSRGRFPVKELEEMAMARGISESTMKRVRSDLKKVGIRATKQGAGGWVLQAPEPQAASPEEDLAPQRGSSSETDPLQQEVIPFDGELENQASSCSFFVGTNLSAPCPKCGGRYSTHEFRWDQPSAAAEEVEYV
jgi:hypothetical protein